MKLVEFLTLIAIYVTTLWESLSEEKFFVLRFVQVKAHILIKWNSKAFVTFVQHRAMKHNDCMLMLMRH